MKHIEQDPYLEDRDRELTDLINEREVIDQIQIKLRLGEAYIVRRGSTAFIKDNKGETLFFYDEEAMKKAEQGRTFLNEVAAIAREHSPYKQQNSEEIYLKIEKEDNKNKDH